MFTCQVPLINEPQNLFFFSINSSGINVAPDKQIGWPFQSVRELFKISISSIKGIFYWNMVLFRRIKSIY